MLSIQHVTYAGILHDLSDEWSGGQFVGLIGPNGAGKSTLLRLLAGVRSPHSGDIFLNGRRLEELSVKERAKQIAYMPQQVADDVPFTVRQFVEMGRYAYRRGLAGLDAKSRGAVESALARMALDKIANISLAELSGGERQRVALARCLAQHSQTLLLDEPISNLDLYYQADLLQLLRQLTREGLLVVLAIHHLEFAAQFCSHLVLLNHGKLYSTGTSSEVLTEQAMKDVFRMDVKTYLDPISGCLRFSYPSLS